MLCQIIISHVWDWTKPNWLHWLIPLATSIPLPIKSDIVGRVYEYFAPNFPLKKKKEKEKVNFTPKKYCKPNCWTDWTTKGIIYDPACGWWYVCAVYEVYRKSSRKQKGGFHLWTGIHTNTPINWQKWTCDSWNFRQFGWKMRILLGKICIKIWKPIYYGKSTF